MEDKILDILKRKGEYVSGEEISAHFKMTRQGLWKHIQDLRDSGYDIVAVPHLGYKLVSSPDKLFPAEITHGLNTRIMGRKLYYYDTCSSTMDIAFQKGVENCPEGTVILAEAQTKGRGRLGRTWESPRHKGAYFSLILRPRILPSKTPLLTLLVSISICEAIKEVFGIEARIKWPNDILVSNKKIGGILTELSAETDRVNFVAIGIGLNVNNENAALVPGAISLKEVKKENLSRVELVQEILRRVEINYLNFQKSGSGPVIEKWRNCNVTIGKRVKVTCCKDHIEAEAVDIDTDGALLLRNDVGLIQKVYTGDVVHCRM